MPTWAYGLCALMALFVIGVLVRNWLLNCKARRIVRHVLGANYKNGQRVAARTDCNGGRHQERRIGIIQKGPRFGERGIFLTISTDGPYKSYKKYVVVADGNGGWKPSNTVVTDVFAAFGG